MVFGHSYALWAFRQLADGVRRLAYSRPRICPKNITGAHLHPEPSSIHRTLNRPATPTKHDPTDNTHLTRRLCP